MKTVFLTQLSILQDETHSCPIEYLWYIEDIIDMELSSHILVGFQTHGMGGNHTGNCKPCQNPMSE